MDSLGHCVRGGLFVLITLLILMTRRAAKTEEERDERRRDRPRALFFAVGLLTFAGIEFWLAAHVGDEHTASRMMGVLSAVALLIIFAGMASKVVLNLRANRRLPRQE